LGVFLDKRLIFGFFVKTVAKRAATSTAALSRLMPNLRLRCPDQCKRRLLNSVDESQLLYATPIWSSVVATTARSMANLVRPQRAMALTENHTYRTVSDETTQVLACMSPTDLFALEITRIRCRAMQQDPADALPMFKGRIIRAAERKTTLDIWRTQWSFSSKEQWTKRLIPDFRRWIERTLPKISLTYR